MSPEAMFSCNSGLVLLICSLFLLIVPFGWAQQRSKAEDFNCPEEFGYYPHPTDCTQYYVCVFGGALLESCTGGLMYSHDLQTCDWPRNVGCGASSVAPSRSVSGGPSVGFSQELRVRQTTPSWQNDFPQQNQDEIPDRHLYEEEELGPAEEIETDRQQRVYRGQPPTLGQVARDRDGIAKHANALQSSAGPEKIKPISVVSFGSHHQSLSNQSSKEPIKSIRQHSDHEKNELESNRVKRSVKSSSTTDRRSNRTMNTNTSRTNGGYALRYKPTDDVFNSTSTSKVHDVTTTNSPSSTLYDANPTENNSQRPYNNKIQPNIKQMYATQQVTAPYFQTAFPDHPHSPPVKHQTQSHPYQFHHDTSWLDSRFKPTARPLIHRNPSLSGSSQVQSSLIHMKPSVSGSSQHQISPIHMSPPIPSGSQFQTPPIHMNPSVSGSSQFQSFADSSQHDPTLTVTDFSIVNIAPKDYPQQPFSSSPYPQPQANTHFRPRFLPPQPVHHANSVFPHNAFAQSNINRHYSSSPPRFYPYYPSNTHYINQEPETAIVTLTYPNSSMDMHKPSNIILSDKFKELTSTTGSPNISANEISTTEAMITSAPSSTEKTSINKTAVVDYQKTNKTKEKIKSTPQSIKAKPQKNDDNEESDNKKITTYKDSYDDDDDAEYDDKGEVEDEHDDLDEEYEKDIFEADDEQNDHVNNTKQHRPEENEHDENQQATENESEVEYEDDTKDEVNDEEKVEEEDDDGYASPPPTFYKKLVHKEIQNPFSEPDFDFDTYLTELEKPTKDKKVKPPEKEEETQSSENNEDDAKEESTELNEMKDKNITRKNDRIIHVRLYEPVRYSANSNRPRLKKPPRANKNVVPMALVHTYKPANYSYPAKHTYKPKNWKIPNRNPNYFPPNRYPQPYTFERTTQTTKDADCHYADCLVEEDENYEDDETADLNDYYDDYSADYGTAHLIQPLTKPKIPSIPSRLKNIDYEITPPPLDEDERIRENEESEYEDDEQNDEVPQNPMGSHSNRNDKQLSTNKIKSKDGDQVMTPIKQKSQLKSPLRDSTYQITTTVLPPKKPTATVSSKQTNENTIMYTTQTKPTTTEGTQMKIKLKNHKIKTKTYNKTGVLSPKTILPFSYASNLVTPQHESRNKTNGFHAIYRNDYNKGNTNRMQTTKSSMRHWPPSSVPTYIIDQSPSTVSVTPKSVYNVTKYEPYFAYEDEASDVYRDIDYGQFNNQGKQQETYQIVQEPQRIQSQPSQVFTNPPSYTNTEYKVHSETEADPQPSDKLTANRLFLDIDQSDSFLKQNDKLPAVPSPFIQAPPIDLTNKRLQLAASFRLDKSNTFNQNNSPFLFNNDKNTFQYESIKSHEFSLNEEPSIGETSQLPTKVTTSFKKTPNYNLTSTTPTLRIKQTQHAQPQRNIKSAISRDNFRIIVEPVRKSKNVTVTGNAANKLSIIDGKLTSRISPTNKISITYSPYSIIQTQTTTTTTTTVKTIKEPERQLTNRRFYIPRNEAGKSTNGITTPAPTTVKLELTKFTPRNVTELSRFRPIASESTRFESIATEPSRFVPMATDPSRTDRTRTAKSKEPQTTASINGDKDIQYYDEEYYDEVEDNNYIDDKVMEYTTPKNVQKHKSKSNQSVPKLQSPFDTQTIPSKNAVESVRTIEPPKDRCPQCNEKPFTRGRIRGSITYTTGGNEYEAVTPASGRTRPTLKPSNSIVSKASDTVDIYKHHPKRPDPIYPTPQVDKAAAKCRKDICLLPDCSCGGKEIPGDLSVEETPQLVLLTFDDSVNELNKGLYTDLFEKGRTNPNGCPIVATFYVSHEWTDYSMVQNLYANGHEMASHSVSHSFGEQFSQRKWTKEIVGQREILSAYGGVRQEDIRGMRAPFLAVGGNKMFKMLYDSNFTYDSSMPIYENRPPSYPYTLDYKLFHDCMIPPCPTRSYPGVWEVPMVMWQDLNGGRCSMGDACSNPSDADGVYKMLLKNFERHFTTNRAPFGLFYHSSWFTQAHHKEGFIAFLDTIVNMPEVWLVTNWQAIQWSRDPTPISRLNSFKPFDCDYPDRPKRCNNPKVCNLWHKSGVRYLKTCQPCPDVYPWTGKTGVRNSRIENDDTLTE